MSPPTRWSGCALILNAAEARQEMLAAELAEIDADVEDLTQLLIRTTEQAQTIAARVDVQRQRIGVLDENAQALEALAAGPARAHCRAPVGHGACGSRATTGAICLARRCAALGALGDLLGVAFPELEAESRVLADDLAALEEARTELDEALGLLLADAEALAQEEERIELVLFERSRLREENQSVLERERERAALLAGEATSLEALLNDLEGELDSVRQAMADAQRAQEEGPPDADDREAIASLQDTGRMSPAFAFGSAQGMIRSPVRGQEIMAFGDQDRFGETSQGLHIATRADARVVAPADGWVLYAGPFRAYGQVVILDVGDGYRMILAGMSRINVALGQFVLMGEPIATMGERGSVVLADGSTQTPQPVLFVELREDGRPIDSSSWWADSDGVTQRDSQRTDG
jgi:septal ring factor EnvC (AmiA/AmiB activator)